MSLLDCVKAAATAAALLFCGYVAIVAVLLLDGAAPLYGGR